MANRSTCAAAGAVALLVAACGAVVDGPSVPHFVVEEELRIGALDGPAALGEVIGLAVGEDGDLFSAEWNEGSIGVFDRDGTPRRRIGRSGSGPGEFTMNPGALHWTGGLLSAADPVARRLHLFRRDGTLDRTIEGRWEAISPAFPAPSPSRLLADGSILGFSYPQASSIARGEAREAVLVKMDSAGLAVHPIVRIPERNATLLIERNPGYVMTVNPVRDETLWSAKADGYGIVLVERRAATSAELASFEVLRIDLTGDTTFSRSYSYKPVALTSAAADSISDALASRLDHGQEFAKLRATIGTMDYLPDFFPPVTSLVTGRDGTIWIRREADGESVSWEVLDAEGNLVRRVTTPTALSMQAVDGDTMWGVLKDSLDVSYIVRYRISAGRL